MKEVLISIVVPIFGVGKYLNECINSLINQTYSNIEIILVDDGSKDNSPEICDSFALADKRIKVIHKNNGGLVSARKAGAMIANGEYICCVDGDDWVANNYIDKICQAIDKTKAELICTGYFESYEDHKKEMGFNYAAGLYDEKKINEVIRSIAIESQNGDIFPPQLWAKCIKKDIYLKEQICVDEKIKIGEDGAVIKPILTKVNSLFIINEPLYFYRINDSSMTKNKSAYSWNGPRAIMNHLVQRIDITQCDYEEQIYRRTAHDLYMVAISQLNKPEKYKIVKKEIIDNLKSEDYQKVIQKCRFQTFKYKSEIFILKKHLIFALVVQKWLNSKMIKRK